MRNIKRGELYYIHPIGGSKNSKAGRPALVVGDSELSSNTGVVQICYLTLKSLGQNISTRVKVTSGHVADSLILCEQVTTVGWDCIGDFIETLSDFDLNNVNNALIRSLSLNTYTSGEKNYEHINEEVSLIEMSLEEENTELNEVISNQKNRITELMEQVNSLKIKYSDVYTRAETLKDMYDSLLKGVVKGEFK